MLRYVWYYLQVGVDSCNCLVRKDKLLLGPCSLVYKHIFDSILFSLELKINIFSEWSPCMQWWKWIVSFKGHYKVIGKHLVLYCRYCSIIVFNIIV